MNSLVSTLTQKQIGFISLESNPSWMNLCALTPIPKFIHLNFPELPCSISLQNQGLKVFAFEYRSKKDKQIQRIHVYLPM